MSKFESKYQVMAVGEDVNTICRTDTPKTAIVAWFEAQAENPSCVAINAISIEAAQLLIDYAHCRKDIIEELHSKYKNPYKLEFLLEAIDNKHNDGCKGFLGYLDQVHPFDLG